MQKILYLCMLALPAVAYADDYVPSPTDTISCNSVTDYVAIISLQLMKDYPPVGRYPIKRTPPSGYRQSSTDIF